MTERNTEDLLRAVVAAWDSWDDDGALRWEVRCKAAIDDARAHLSPRLPVEDDPPSVVRSVP